MRFTDLKTAVKQAVGRDADARIWVIDGRIVTVHFIVPAYLLMGDASKASTSEVLHAACGLKAPLAERIPTSGHIDTLVCAVGHLLEDEESKPGRTWRRTPLFQRTAAGVLAVIFRSDRGEYCAFSEAYWTIAGKPDVMFGKPLAKGFGGSGFSPNPEADAADRIVVMPMYCRDEVTDCLREAPEAPALPVPL